MGHRMIQGEIVAQILKQLEKNCDNYTVVKFIVWQKDCHIIADIWMIYAQ